MIGKVFDFVCENSMIEKGDKIIVAVSGGPDSICLLDILNKLKSRFGISLLVAHINHCLRGEESDKDEEYVRSFCQRENIPFHSKKVAVDKVALERNISCESAGREVRYEYFMQLLNSENAQKVAIAHNANDRAETVLMRIIRGTGLQGLEGIKPIRDKVFIRPILSCTRYEIEKYCLENNLNPRIDKTNLQNIYARNKIRLDVIPYIESNFNADVLGALNRLADTVARDNEYLTNVSNRKYKKYCDKTQHKVIICKEAFKEPEAMISRIIIKALTDVKGDSLDIEKNHIQQIISLQAGETGKEKPLPNDIIALNNYGNITIYLDKYKEKIIDGEYILNFGDNVIQDLNCNFKIKLFTDEKSVKFSHDGLTMYFDYDKIIRLGNIKLRFRKPGDRFIPLGMNGNKKLKSFFIDLKIEKEKRDKTPLICFGDDVGWIVGYRMGDQFKLDESTKNILEIKVESEEA